MVTRSRCIAALMLALLFILTACGQPDPLAYQRRLFEQQQAQQAAQRAQERQEALEPLHRGVEAAWLLFVAVVPLVALIMAVDAYRQRRRPLVHPDARGLLPVSRPTIEAVRFQQQQLEAALIRALESWHHTQQIAAARPVLPDRLTYSPHITTSQVAAERSALPDASPHEDRPALPDQIALADALPRVKPGNIVLGMGPDGLIQLSFAACYHALWTGDTRTGKTNGLDGVIVQLHHLARRMPITLYGADYKRELSATWNRSRLFGSGILTNPRDVADLLAELVNGADGVRARYARFEQAGQDRGRIVRNIIDFARISGGPPRLVVLVLDELNALLEAAGKGDLVADHLRQLLQMGAGAGVYVLGGAQYLTAAVFGRDGSKQFTSRALFGTYDPTAARMMFGSTPTPDMIEQLTGGQGRGLIRTVQQQQPIPFQALRCDESDILGAIELVTTDGSTYSSATTSATAALQAVPVPAQADAVAFPSTTSTAPEQGADGASTVAPDVPETERAVIIALAEAKLSRRAICKQLYGSEGGRDYKKVQAVLDAAGL